MSNDRCLRCEAELAVYCGRCMEDVRRRLDETTAKVDGLGTGMTALSMLLGHPAEGLVEAVRSLLQKQQNYERDRAAWDAAAERASMQAMIDRLAMSRDERAAFAAAETEHANKWSARARAAEKERDEARALRTDEAEKAKREIMLLRQRVSDLKFALGTDATGWFDRSKAAEKERDDALAEAERWRNAHHEACVRLQAHDCGEEYALLGASAEAAERKVASLTKQIEQMLDDGLMACETPPNGCECSGCSYARERAKEGRL